MHQPGRHQVNRPKQIGTAAETAVVKAARRLGFPNADRLTLTGANDRGDVGLCPGVIVEVKGGQAAKAAGDGLIQSWLVETSIERVNAGADFAILVTQRAGIGLPNAHRWWAHMRVGTFLDLMGGMPIPPPMLDSPLRMTLADALALFRAAGFGEPIRYGVAS